MGRAAVLGSARDGDKNRDWGIIEDTFISDQPLPVDESGIVVGKTNQTVIQLEKTSTKDEVGLLLLKMPEQPDGGGKITRVYLNLYCLTDLTDADDTLFIHTAEEKNWNRAMTSWDRRVEFSEPTGSQQGIAKWSDDTDITEKSAGEFNPVDDTVITYTAGTMIQPTEWVAFELHNSARGSEDSLFTWGSTATLVLKFAGSDSSTKNCSFVGTYGRLVETVANYIPDVQVYYEMEDPRAESQEDTETFLTTGMTLGINDDESRQPLPIFEFEGNEEVSYRFQKYSASVYDGETRKRYRAEDAPFREMPILIEPAIQVEKRVPIGTNVTFSTTTKQVDAISWTDVTVGGPLIIPISYASTGIANLLTVADRRTGNDENFKTWHVKWKSWHEFEVEGTLSNEIYSEGVILSYGTKPMTQLTMSLNGSETANPNVCLGYYTPRDSILRRDSEYDPEDFNDAVGMTVEVLNAAGPTTDYNVDDLYHIAIDTATDFPVEIRTTDTDELVAYIPAGYVGPVVVSSEDSGIDSIDMVQVLIDAGFTSGYLSPYFDLSKKWYFRLFSRHNNTELNKPYRSKEYAFNPTITDLTLLNRNVDTADVGDDVTVGLNWTDPGDVTHFDFSFRDDADGNRVFRRVPIDKSETIAGPAEQIETTFRYGEAGTFDTSYRFYIEDGGWAGPWTNVDLGDDPDVVISARDPETILYASPSTVRVGDFVYIDGRSSAPGASNHTLEYRTSFKDQDFDFNGDDGTGKQDITSESFVTDPIFTAFYTKNTGGDLDLGSAKPFPKRVRVRLGVRDAVDNSKAGTAVAYVTVEDNVALDLRSVLGGTAIKSIGDAVKRDSSLVKVSGGGGDILVDGGFAGYTSTISGESYGNDFSRDLRVIKLLHEAQSYIQIEIPEIGLYGRKKIFKGTLMGQLKMDHTTDRGVAWSVPYHIEKVVESDEDGNVAVRLTCGDDVPGGRRGWMVRGGDIYSDANRVPATTESPVYIYDPIEQRYWTPDTAIPTLELLTEHQAGSWGASKVEAFIMGTGLTGVADDRRGRFDVPILIDADRPFVLQFEEIGGKEAESERYNPLTDTNISVKGLLLE